MKTGTQNNPTQSVFRSRLVVYLIFAVSGGSALIYQILWARWMSLLFGVTTISVAVVLSSFMFGLALGSWIAGRRINRIKNPMMVYSGIELGIGIYALLFPLLTGLMDWVFVATVDSSSPVWFSYAVRTLLAFGMLVIPTTLMGTTLPLLAEFFRGYSTETSGWKAGHLYAANTFGAALGTLLAGMLLIELIGIRNTTLLAAGLNLLVAAMAFLIGRKYQSTGAARIAPDSPIDDMGRIAIGVLAASGAVAMASEVLWTRMLVTIIGNSSYAFSVILVVYLVGIAMGSWLVSLFVKKITGLPLWLAGTQLAIGLWTAVAIACYDHLYQWMSLGLVPISEILVDYLQAAAILFPLALFSGAAFPLATRMLDRTGEASGEKIAQAYAWNTIGAMAGALLAGFLIAPHLGFFESLYLLAALSSIVALGTLLITAWRRLLVGAKAASLTLTIASVCLVAFGCSMALNSSEYAKRISAATLAWKLVYHKPGLQGVTSALTIRGGTGKNGLNDGRLLVNGCGMTGKVTITKIMAHLPMLLHPDPENTLVICFGMGTTYRSAISHNGRVTVVELVDEVYEAFDVFFDDAERVRSYPKGKMITNDGRSYLKLVDEKFDVITIDPPPPIDAAGVNHLYSKDFIELARSRLKEGGIMAHWIPFPSAKGIGVGDQETFKMLVRTFTEVFPYTYQIDSLSNFGLHVLGSHKPINLSTTSLQSRLEHREIADDLNEWENVPLDYFEQVSEIDLRLLSDNMPMVVTDDHPLLEFYLWRKWKSGLAKSHRTLFLYR